MLEKVNKTLSKEGQLDFEKPLIVGVSGGPDSLSLLHVLKELGYSLVATHINHGLRPEAEADAGYVNEVVERLGISLISGSEDTNSFASDQGMSVEEAARHLRYRFLFAEAEKLEAQAVAVGHTANDQVETVLMHLLRGAGLSGLRGMQVCSVIPTWHEDIPLIRPLLNIWREEILAYCQAHDLQPRFDHSNLDITFFRNRIRHELLPVLEGYNPQVRKLIWRMADTLSADFRVLEGVIERTWEECVLDVGEGFVVLNLEVFIRQLKGVQRAMVRRAIAHLRPGLRDIDYEAVERSLTFVYNPTKTNKSDLIAGLYIQVEGDRFWIGDWGEEIINQDKPQLGVDYVKLKIPGRVDIGDDWFLKADCHSAEEKILQEAINNEDPFTGWFDANTFSSEVLIRPRHTGDRFQPLGMEGHSVKLADFFINVKLPRSARKRWPLICAGDQIAWVPGYRLGHPFRITEGTKEIVKLHLFMEPNIA
jgi:tRNA(Ile)-lysidine synthase